MTSQRPTSVAATPARRLRDAGEPLAMHVTGSPAVRAAVAAVGLDRFSGWVWGRAAALGDPAPEEVVAAFAVFEPVTLRAAHLTARAACPRDVLLDARTRATVGSLRDILRPVDLTAVAGVVAALRSALPPPPSAGWPLYAGLAGLPWPEDPLGQLWRACDLVREHRGDTHQLVCARHGLDPVERNVLTELWLGMPLGSYTRTRGWGEAAVAGAVDRLERRRLVDRGELTDRGRAFRAAVEAETDDGEGAVVDALRDRLEPVVTALEGWSRRCIAAGAFTTDEAKRAAG